MLAFAQFNLELRRRNTLGQGGEDFVGSPAFEIPSQDLQQPGGRVDAIVETVPALGEEEVSAHFPGKLGGSLAHLGFDQ